MSEFKAKRIGGGRYEYRDCLICRRDGRASYYGAWSYRCGGRTWLADSLKSAKAEIDRMLTQGESK